MNARRSARFHVTEILKSHLVGITLLFLTVSYDIACQWKINLLTRMKKLPSALQINPEAVNLQFGLPIWHASAHEVSCQMENGLGLQEGVGRTDGEGIERTWAEMNTMATSTKEMGEGARHDSLDDHFSFHNFEKNIQLEKTLDRKLLIAVEERDHQIACFKEINSGLDYVTRQDWESRIQAWEGDRSKPNPYFLDKTGTLTEGEVRLCLRNEELQELAKGSALIHETSATSFLVAGLELEDLQFRIREELSGHTKPTANQLAAIQHKRRQFFGKLRKFRDLQKVYMPGAIRAIAAEEEDRDADADAPKAEDVVLWLPSDLDQVNRINGCTIGLADMEAQLRAAQCSDSLDRIRSHLHAKHHLINHRNQNVTGQNQSTRARTLIGRVSDRATPCAEKYRRARAALVTLQGLEACAERFKVLKDSDLHVDQTVDNDAVAMGRMSRAGGGAGPRTKKNAKGKHKKGRSQKEMSWLWTAGRAPDEQDNASLHCSVRVEWAKARARKRRWVEEVALLKEEMRRVRQYLEWEINLWEGRSHGWFGLQLDIQAGVIGYAHRQAHWRGVLLKSFSDMWDKPAFEAARNAALENAVVLFD